MVVGFSFPSHFPPFLPLTPFQSHLDVFTPPPESPVHLAPQIAYDSRTISSRGFELNWSEQYHLCLLKGRSGSRCCSTERNREEGGRVGCVVGWDGEGGEEGGKKLLPATIKASVSHAICPAGSPVRRGELRAELDDSSSLTLSLLTLLLIQVCCFPPLTFTHSLHNFTVLLKGSFTL